MSRNTAGHEAPAPKGVKNMREVEVIIDNIMPCLYGILPNRIIRDMTDEEYFKVWKVLCEFANMQIIGSFSMRNYVKKAGIKGE